MSYKLVISEQFAATLAQITAQYPACQPKIDVAMKMVKENALACGNSTNRDLKYVGTRETKDAPGLWLFFHVDIWEGTATFTIVSHELVSEGCP